jgi:Ca-activated chloride channel homolog
MSHTETAFTLSSCDPDGPEPALTAVTARGQLDGLLLELTLRQHYRNHHASPLEVVYTFPLPADAVLLGFASELNGQRMCAFH